MIFVSRVDELDAVAKLARQCGCLPITLHIAAVRLATRPHWPVARVVEQLRNEPSRLAALDRLSGTENPITAVFDWVLHELAPYVADLYRLLGRLPTRDFGPELAAAVTERATPDIALVLQTLADAGLLDEVGNGRYRFDDLVRLHARAQCAKDSDEAVPRAARWYLREITRRYLVVIPLRWRVSPVADELAGEPPAYVSDTAALDWLAGELPNVLAVLEDAVLDRHDELAWQLCEVLWEHAEHVGRTADSRQFFLTTPFEPAAQEQGNEFVALFLFDRSGGRCLVGRAASGQPMAFTEPWDSGRYDTSAATPSTPPPRRRQRREHRPPRRTHIPRMCWRRRRGDTGCIRAVSRGTGWSRGPRPLLSVRSR